MRELTGSFYMALGAVGMLVIAGMLLLLIGFRGAGRQVATAAAA